MTEFYVIMAKRQDGKVYADLHKTNEVIYGTMEDAYEEWNNTEHYKEYFHIVKLIACLPETLDELAQGHSPKPPVMPYNTLISNQTNDRQLANQKRS
jgi:hypothetical protein